MSEARERAQTGILELAATKLIEKRANHRWMDNPTIKIWLAAAISSEMTLRPDLRAGREQIKTNWVTLQSVEIEARRRKKVSR
jgi:hypothetical protein